MNKEQIVEALASGETVTVPYHIENHGPGKSHHSIGQAELGEAAGPEGFLRLGLDSEGRVIVDEWDDDVCPEEFQGIEYFPNDHAITNDA